MIDLLLPELSFASGQLHELSQLLRTPEILLRHVLDPSCYQGMTVRLRASDDSEPGADVLSEGIVGEQVGCAVVAVSNSQVEEVAPV